ncbi:enoyl-CoA hydratase/isomerase family protein [Nocardia aurantia]|uniref:enoyl-CoA hydratase/isomerase family protein n=1 Tax=Nocardia aurantia TaxID=2585199 RepID=UPI001295570F|nr:enoyl-CoA hydratase/isomerase family protein [Nocardia aurantia]
MGAVPERSTAAESQSPVGAVPERSTAAALETAPTALETAPRAREPAAPPGPDVLVERHGAVLLLTLNRPQRHNAVGGSMFRDLSAAFDEAGRDDGIRVVVTTGTGDAFCVGADVRDFAAVAHLPARDLLLSDLIGGDKGLPELSPDGRVLDEIGNAGRWAARMWALEKPTLAAINGAAVGGGLAVALLHDIRIAARSARLGTGFAPAGLASELGLSYLLPRVTGMSVAAELLFGGRLVGSAEARELRLVSETVDDEQLLDRALETAERIAAQPSRGLQWNKRLLRRSMDSTLAEQLRAEYVAQLALFDDPETRAALVRLTRRVTGET